MSAIPITSFPASTGTVEKIDLPTSVAARLKSLGVFEGQEFELARRGHPLILKIAGSRIAIADDIAGQIFVRT